jgi:hypothetical protein
VNARCRRDDPRRKNRRETKDEKPFEGKESQRPEDL